MDKYNYYPQVAGLVPRTGGHPCCEFEDDQTHYRPSKLLLVEALMGIRDILLGTSATSDTLL